MSKFFIMNRSTHTDTVTTTDHAYITTKL